jgi:outer membrane protein insertion porin family
VFLTRRGTRVDFSPYIAGSFLGGSTDIFGFDITASHYIPLPYDTILLFNGEVASVDTYADGDRVPVFDRLYAGGAQNLRGFGFRKVGPKDYKGNPVGGRTLVRATAEYTFPIIERARGALFYDLGYVNKDAFSFAPESYYDKSDFRTDPNRVDNDPRTPLPNPSGNDTKNFVFGGDLNMDIGVGVRLDLPIGPLRLDYGLPLLGDKFNKRTYGKFNFNVGYQF